MIVSLLRKKGRDKNLYSRLKMLTIVHTISKNGHWVSLFANEQEAEKIKGKPLYCYKRSRVACVDLEGK